MKVITKIDPSNAVLAKKKKRVAAYCRVSTGMDAQIVSLETQKSHYEDYINANPEWEFAGLYYDEGISGTKKESRPALLQMIADCEDGKVDYIVTKSLSRLARNTTDCLELVRKLLGLGIPIYFEKENLDTGSMESELLLSIMSSLAESESISISENSKWSVRHRFENGTFKIGYAPYGYSVKYGEFAILEEEAEWVRYIFSETLSGKSSAAIARNLNKKQVPTRRNGTWTASTIRGILRNEKYTGDCLFQKTYSDFQFKRHTNRGERDQFYMEDHHEAIISREDFEAVGQLIAQHAKEKNIKKADQKYQNKYPFTGKIFCGCCGSPFKRKVNYTGNLRYPSWVCREHIDHKEHCPMKAIREDDIERAFMTVINKLVFGRKEVLQVLLDSLRSETHKASLRRINDIDTQLEQNAERRKTLTSIMAKGYLEPALYTKECNELAVEADRLAAEKARLVQEINGNMEKTDALGELLRFANHCGMLTEFDGALVERFLDRMIVHSRNEITFCLKCGLEVKEEI